MKKISKSEFFRNTVTLSGGLIVSQAIPVLIAPLLTRIYSIELFGIYFIYSAIVVILSIFATFQYEVTLVLPKDDSDSVNLLGLSILVSFATSILLTLIILFLNHPIAVLLGNENIGPWLFFIPVSILLTGIFQSFNYYGNRFKDYKKISAGRVVKASSTAVAQIPMSFGQFEKFGLIGGMVFGQFISTVYMVFSMRERYRLLLNEISINRMIELAKQYKDVPLYNTLMGIQNRISNHLPFFLLGHYYGLTAVSLYGLAHRIVNTPAGIISQSIGQVFFQRASEIYNENKDLHRLVKSIYVQLIKVSVIPFILLFLTAPYLFKYIFGSEWALTGRIIQLLIPWLFMMFLNNPITSLITILNKQKVLVVYNFFLLLFRFAGIYLGFKIYNNEYYSILFYSLSGFIFNFVICFYILHIAKNESDGTNIIK